MTITSDPGACSRIAALERDLQRELGYGDDYREGVAAFIGKRAPRFSGR